MGALSLLKGALSLLKGALSLLKGASVNPEVNKQAHEFLEDCIEKEVKACGDRYRELKVDMKDRFDKLDKTIIRLFDKLDKRN